MPETMSPREKVANTITYNPVYGNVWEGADPTKGHVYHLASSGDHAELARLAEAAQNATPTEEGSRYGEYAALADVVGRERVDFWFRANPATILALIADVAALRAAKWEVQHIDTMNDMVLMGMARDDADARATEAERKLAEAVGLLGEALGDMDRRVITAETCNRIDYFLSKEAERG